MSCWNNFESPDEVNFCTQTPTPHFLKKVLIMLMLGNPRMAVTFSPIIFIVECPSLCFSSYALTFKTD